MLKVLITNAEKKSDIFKHKKLPKKKTKTKIKCLQPKINNESVAII